MTTPDVHHTIAANVRRLRDHLGLTQAELANAAGVSLATIQDVERAEWRHAKTNPTLRRIAKALDTTLADLRRGMTQDEAELLLARQRMVREFFRRRVEMLRLCREIKRAIDDGAVAEARDMTTQIESLLGDLET